MSICLSDLLLVFFLTHKPNSSREFIAQYRLGGSDAGSFDRASDTIGRRFWNSIREDSNQLTGSAIERPFVGQRRDDLIRDQMFLGRHDDGDAVRGIGFQRMFSLWRPRFRQVELLAQLLRSPTRVEPVADIAFRGQSRQPQQSHGAGDSQQRAGDRLAVTLSGGIVVEDDDDATTSQKLGQLRTPLPGPARVGRRDHAE